jgi:tripartite-type tricarboxylate transporter receptor subunit TctC
MKRNRGRAAAKGLVLGLAALVLCALPAVAKDISFKDKRLIMLIGSEPGGGTDTSGRLIAPFFSKYLPGNPNIVVQNMPGAGGIAAQNYFVNQVKPDGLTFTTGASSQIDPLLYRKPTAGYDPTKYAYIGGMGRGGNFLLVNKENEPRLHDKTKEPLVMGSNSAPRTGVQMALWGIEYLGWNARWVTAYRGTNDMFLALERGEIDMTATANFFRVQKAMATGKFKVLAQSGSLEDGKIVPRPELADTPIFSNLMKGKIADDLGKQGYDYWLSMSATDKWVALPPGTPKDMVDAYREAFRKIAKDPTFVSEGKKMSEDFTPMTAEDVEGLVRTVGATSPEAIEYINTMMRHQGIRVE